MLGTDSFRLIAAGGFAKAKFRGKDSNCQLLDSSRGGVGICGNRFSQHRYSMLQREDVGHFAATTTTAATATATAIPTTNIKHQQFEDHQTCAKRLTSLIFNMIHIWFTAIGLPIRMLVCVVLCTLTLVSMMSCVIQALLQPHSLPCDLWLGRLHK